MITCVPNSLVFEGSILLVTLAHVLSLTVNICNKIKETLVKALKAIDKPLKDISLCTNTLLSGMCPGLREWCLHKGVLNF